MDRIPVAQSVEMLGPDLVFANYPLTETRAHSIRDRGTASTGDDIRQDPMLGSYEYTWVPVRRGLLDQFTRLHEASDATILRFARRWGGLFICEHGLPNSHSPDSIPFGLHDGCSPLGWGGHSWWEPIEAWKALSERAYAMLRIAIALRDKGMGPLSDWELLAKSPESRAREVPGNIRRAWFYLSLHLEQWLMIGQVGPKVHAWRESGIAIRLGGRHLFGAIGYLLALACSGSTGLAVCSFCKALHRTKRRPALGRRTYCGPCRAAGRPLLDAKRDSRRRLAEARAVQTRAKVTGSSSSSPGDSSKRSRTAKRSRGPGGNGH
jgi:hypothetical protein